MVQILLTHHTIFQLFMKYGQDGQKIFDVGGYTALRHSLGLVTGSTSVSLVCSHDKSIELVEHFWNYRCETYGDGCFDSLLQLFSFMHLSVKYQIILPPIDVI